MPFNRALLYGDLEQEKQQYIDYIADYRMRTYSEGWNDDDFFVCTNQGNVYDLTSGAFCDEIKRDYYSHSSFDAM